MWFRLYLVLLVAVELVLCQDGTFFLKASKSVPRIGKRSRNNNNNNDDFEKFFLKASKSVPRIGRRDSNPVSENTKDPRTIKYPKWSDLTEMYEYNPELFSSPQLLAQLETFGMLADDPSSYDWDKIRFKRTSAPVYINPNKEVPEYQYQAEK